MRRCLLLLLLIALAGAPAFANQSAPGLRRFALFVGSNDGGPGRVRLQYAESDARSMAEVMQELGGVANNDSLVLLAPTTYDLETGLHMMAARIRQARERSERSEQARRLEFILYYSGHSDEQGLLLGHERVPYTDLKETIQKLPVDVNIAILDSCFSGAFTRLKGGARQLPFLLDESAQMKGHAFLTSSSADEAAQESDSIQGSFFTHYLIAGLRGAADSTRDEQISLNEVYHYAFSETLARTQSSQAGVQHPSYNIQLTGTGDLTMTDLRAASSGLLLRETVEGRLYVRNHLGALMAEVRKDPGAPLLLAFPAGRYALSLNQGGRSLESSCLLRPGERVELSQSDFRIVGREATTRRGDAQEPGQEQPLPAAEQPVSYEPFQFGLLPFVSGADGARTVYALSLNLLVGYAYGIRGAQLSSIMNITEDGVAGAQAAGVGNIVEGELSGMQYAGVFNMAGRDSRALQLAGVFNLAEGRASFLQMAGVFNMSGESFGGLQGAGVFNISQGRLNGFQTAGVFNVAEGPVAGAQIAGVFNSATRVSGAQVGLVNVSRDVDGTQVGLVNIAGGTVRGAQVGLVNIAKDLHGIPVGLINVVEQGVFRVSTWFSELGLGYLGFEMGSRTLYTLMYGGVALADNPSLYTAALGFGLHIPVGPFFVNVDLAAKSAWAGFSQEELRATFDQGGLSPVFPSARILAGVRVLGIFSLFGGVLLDGHIEGYTVQTGLHRGPSFTMDFWNAPVVLFPKLLAGIKF